MLTVIFVLALIALLACVVLFAGSYLFADDRDAQWMVTRRKKFGFGSLGSLAIILAIMFNPFIVIDSGERGILKTWGAVDMQPLDEGLHVIIPLVQKVDVWNVRVVKLEAPAAAASKDLQDVHTTWALNLHLIPDTVPAVYKSVGSDVYNRIVMPAMQEVLKSVTAQYTAEELITKREEVNGKIKTMITARVLPYGLAVDELAITNFKFSQNFTEAIEAKQEAEQLALKAKRDLDRVRVEAEQKIASARAEAESLRLQKQEITPELIKLREIEMQTKAVEKWNGALPSVTGGVIPFLDVGTASK